MFKGSLSVFFALIIVAVMTLIFSLGECVRIYALSSLSTEYVNMAADSTFSEYNSYLWEKYHILGLDLAYGSNTATVDLLASRMEKYSQAMVNPQLGVNLCRLAVKNVNVDNYSFLTDDGGNGVIYQGSKYVKENISVNIINELENRIQENNSLEEIDIDEQVNSGKDSVHEAKACQREALESGEISKEEYCEPEDVEDNPMDAYGKFKDMLSGGILKSVIPDEENISTIQLPVDSFPSKRQLMVGTGNNIIQENFIDKTLYIKYLTDNFQSYGNALGHDGMKFEVEYLIGHKATDKENLANVVEKLLLMREAANYCTILQSSRMMTEVDALAAVISSFAPAIYEPVKIAIIAAWAYVESVLDVRLLLKGGTIALMKTQEQWTSDVAHLSDFLDVNKTAKNCTQGMSYKEFLSGCLMLLSMKDLGLRSCDVLEYALNTQKYYEYVHLDNMIYSCEMTEQLCGREIFLSLISSSSLSNQEYEINRQVSRCY